MRLSKDSWIYLPQIKNMQLKIIERQLVELRREQIVQRAKQAIAYYRRGNVKELYQDLESS